jgi:hypothetical protein
MVGNMPGGPVPDSFGYSSATGNIRKEAKVAMKAETYDVGDTIGCGILVDTYRQRRMFWTKNGVKVGIIQNFLADGMDFVPTGIS